MDFRCYVFNLSNQPLKLECVNGKAGAVPSGGYIPYLYCSSLLRELREANAEASAWVGIMDSSFNVLWQGEGVSADWFSGLKTALIRYCAAHRYPSGADLWDFMPFVYSEYRELAGIQPVVGSGVPIAMPESSEVAEISTPESPEVAEVPEVPEAAVVPSPTEVSAKPKEAARKSKKANA